jgi:DNA polymerase III subunit gamma/tau
LKPYVVLARRYRPRNFGEILGQDSVARTLQHAIETGRVAHAYLFAGPRGVGKTSMARILAKAICCLKSDGPTTEPCGECELCRAAATGDDLDVIEIDGASNGGIEKVRELRDNARFTPARARAKIYIIDEVHMVSTAAFNALLKILEEPPEHVKFIFATTEAHKVPATILSRCQRFDFRRIPARVIAAHLRRICEAEGVEAPDEVLGGIARASNGGMRDAQSLLDQMITLSEAELRADDLESLIGTVTQGRMDQVTQAVGENAAGDAIRVFEETYDRGIDPVEFMKQSLETVRNFLVLLTCGEDTDLVDMTPEAQITAAKIARLWGLPRVLYGLGLFADTLKTIKAVGEGRALAELALVKLSSAGNLRSLDDILKDLEELRKKVGRPSARAAATPVAAPAAPATRAAPTAAPTAEPGAEERVLFKSAALPDEGPESDDRPAFDLDTVRASWSEVVDRVQRESSAVGSFLASSKVLGLTDNAVSVGFVPAARFQKAQLDDADRIRVVEEVLKEFFGRPLRLKTAVTEAAGEVDQKEDAPAPSEEEGSRRVTREEMLKIEREPIINTIKELFMARLVNIERT